MITHDQVIELNNALIDTYGPDITHTVIVKALENGFESRGGDSLLRWARTVAWNLVNHEYNVTKRISLFSDMRGFNYKKKLNSPNYYTWQNKPSKYKAGASG